MSTLRHLQNNFQAYLVKGKTAIEKNIVGTEKVSVATRLGIYGHAYCARLIDALADNYPVLRTYLGQEWFEEMAQAYLVKYPSTYRSIRWFGEDLEKFLTNEKEYQVQPYLAEIAAFEWKLSLVFDAADSETLRQEDLAKIAPEQWMDLRFRPHPSLHRIDLSWNVVPIWQALNEENPPPDPQKSATKVPYVLWRRDLINRFSSVPADEAWALDAILKGLDFGEICEGLCEWVAEEEAGLRMASLLKGWIQSGLLASVE